MVLPLRLFLCKIGRSLRCWRPHLGDRIEFLLLFLYAMFICYGRLAIPWPHCGCGFSPSFGFFGLFSSCKRFGGNPVFGELSLILCLFFVLFFVLGGGVLGSSHFGVKCESLGSLGLAFFSLEGGGYLGFRTLYGCWLGDSVG